MDSIRMIDAEAVKKTLTYDRLLPAVEKSLGAFSKGPLHPEGAVQPLRLDLNLKQANGNLLVMPGYLPAEGAIATKLLSLFPGNSCKGLATHNGVVILFSNDSGTVQAIIDAYSLTNLRTASSSAIASKYLAPEKVRKVAILGSGPIAEYHARVHHFVYTPEEIRVWSRTESNAQRMVNLLRKDGVAAVRSASVDEAVKDADIVNLCMPSLNPGLNLSQVKPGAHINAVGAPTPNKRELDDDLIKSAVLYTDSKVSALAESGDVIDSKAEIYAEIGDVINGKKEAMRSKTTIYKSLGIAVLDTISARILYDNLDSKNGRKS